MTSPDWIPTEQRNTRTVDIDRQDAVGILQLINAEDSGVPAAVAAAIPALAPVVDRAVESLRQGGRLIYVGAGTSGRLGVLDAAECPPTFSTDPRQVVALIAGGSTALQHAVEGAEDDAHAGQADLEALNVQPAEVVVGLSASGGAAYVVAAVEAARARGAYTAAITCHAASRLAQSVDQPVVVDVGPEVLAGSTRMKAGTAQKLLLNMLSTATMIRLGKTYENWMVDVRPTNQKLRLRARRIVALLGEVSEAQAETLLNAAGQRLKPAVLMARQGVSMAEAMARLEAAGGRLREALS